MTGLRKQQKESDHRYVYPALQFDTQVASHLFILHFIQLIDLKHEKWCVFQLELNYFNFSTIKWLSSVFMHFYLPLTLTD